MNGIEQCPYGTLAECKSGRVGDNPHNHTITSLYAKIYSDSNQVIKVGSGKLLGIKGGVVKAYDGTDKLGRELELDDLDYVDFIPFEKGLYVVGEKFTVFLN